MWRGQQRNYKRILLLTLSTNFSLFCLFHIVLMFFFIIPLIFKTNILKLLNFK